MKATTPKARELAYNRGVTSIHLKALRVAEEEKLPPSEDDDDKKDNPFEEFINQNLPLDSVPKEGARPPADDASDKGKKGDKKPADGFFDGLDDDDDDDDDEKPVTRSPFSSFRPPGSNPLGSKPPAFGSGSRFGGGSGSSDDKPDKPTPPPFGGSRFGGGSPFSFSGTGSRFGGSGSNPPSGSGASRFGAGGSSPNPPNKPDDTRLTFGSLNTGTKGLRSLSEDPKTNNMLYTLIGVVIALTVALTLMHVDRLRMTIALKDGQITELRYQVESLEARLNNLPPPTPPAKGE